MIPKRKSARQLCRELEDRLWQEADEKRRAKEKTPPVIRGPWKKPKTGPES